MKAIQGFFNGVAISPTYALASGDWDMVGPASTSVLDKPTHWKLSTMAHDKGRAAGCVACPRRYTGTIRLHALF